MKKKILAIIPARAGSKRLNNKNKRILAGKPLVAWVIEAAISSGVFDDVLVSTDDPEIVQIANNLGISVPFIRPDYLATDQASSLDVVFHALNYYLERNTEYENVCLIQPTSPLIDANNCKEAVKCFFEKKADSVISVCETEHSPLWSNTLPSNNSLKNFIHEDNRDKRSQDFPKYYRLNGAFYISKTAELINKKTFFMGEKSFAYKMNKMQSIDIDDLMDFEMAEYFLQKRLNSK